MIAQLVVALGVALGGWPIEALFVVVGVWVLGAVCWLAGAVR
jgi:hypothetical protein